MNVRREETCAMRLKTCLLALGVCVAIIVSVGNAEEKYGITIYPGAKYDSGTSEFLKQISPQSAAYRTGDSVEKIVAFYKKQPGFKLLGNSEKEGAMFRKGKVDITIQSPWMNTTTGKMMNDTLIFIVPRPE
jgi:hypothetical protein